MKTWRSMTSVTTRATSTPINPRTARVWTQKHCATALGNHKNMVGRWERGQIAIPLDAYPGLVTLDSSHIRAGLAVVNLQTGDIFCIF